MKPKKLDEIQEKCLDKQKVREVIEKEIWQLDCRQKDADKFMHDRAIYLYAIDRLRFILKQLGLKGE
jgi:hypothetical protein